MMLKMPNINVNACKDITSSVLICICIIVVFCCFVECKGGAIALYLACANKRNEFVEIS